jgi:polar amino acid transport system substrate-binding protein
MDARQRGLLVPTGRLRAAMNLGNRALVRPDGDGLTGVSPALARRLAEALGVSVELRRYDSARAVWETAQTGVWDVAFLAIDPKRTEKLAFSRPYVRIEGTYAVRAASAFADVAQADSAGHTVLVARGAAYDLFLTGALHHAAIIRAASPTESMQRFRDGEGDLVAGVRQSLETHFRGDPAYRILPGRFTTIDQAICVPVANAAGLPLVNTVLDAARTDGFIATALGDSGAATPI